jgi:hypothetical protein
MEIRSTVLQLFAYRRMDVRTRQNDLNVGSWSVADATPTVYSCGILLEVPYFFFSLHSLISG